MDKITREHNFSVTCVSLVAFFVAFFQMFSLENPVAQCREWKTQISLCTSRTTAYGTWRLPNDFSHDSKPFKCTLKISWKRHNDSMTLIRKCFRTASKKNCETVHCAWLPGWWMLKGSQHCVPQALQQILWEPYFFQSFCFRVSLATQWYMWYIWYSVYIYMYSIVYVLNFRHGIAIIDAIDAITKLV